MKDFAHPSVVRIACSPTFVVLSCQSLGRAILYQRVRARDSPHTNSRIYLWAGIERGSSLFMWISLDQVGGGHLHLGRLNLRAMAASSPASRCAGWLLPLLAQALCARRSFSVSPSHNLMSKRRYLMNKDHSEREE